MVIFCFLDFFFSFSFLFYGFSNENNVLAGCRDSQEVDLSDDEEFLDVDLEEISNFLNFHLEEREIETDKRDNQDVNINIDEIGLPITPGGEISDSEKISYENKVDSMFKEYVTSLENWSTEEIKENDVEEKIENSFPFSKEEGEFSLIKYYKNSLEKLF